MFILLRYASLTALIGMSSVSQGEVTLLSRNMPTHCEFVYNVFSEINIDWQPGVDGALLQYDLFQEYDDTWHTRLAMPMSCEEDAKKCSVSFALESMSTAEHFLFRKIQFWLVDHNGHPLTERYQATFGREFGERCYSDSDQTPFRTREVIEVEIEGKENSGVVLLE